MEGGRAAERAPAAAAAGYPPRPPGLPDLSDHRLARYDAERSPPPSLTGGVITRKVVEWDPGSPAREWVRRVTHDGRALAIRREQDARRGLASRSLGITPLVRHEPAPRVRTAPRPSSSSGAAPDRAITANRSAWGAASGALGHPLRPPRAAGLPHALATHPMSARAATLPPPPPTGPLRPGTNPFPGPFVPAPPRRPSSTERGGGAAAPAAHMPDLPGGHVTFCGPTAPPPLFAAMPSGTGVQAASARRAGTSTAPAVTCTVPSGRASAPDRLRGKGSKHARLCPWIAALDYLPPLPLTGAKRARAGLAAVPLASEDIDKIRRERSARALVAILPWSAAGFILGDSDAMVTARSPEETTARLIRALAAYGVSSVDAAQSALGRLVSWVVVHRPDALTVEGSHVSDFLEYEQPSTATLTALAWLRDHCGLAIPARGPVCRAFRGRPPTAPRSKESMSLGVVVGLEHLAAHHHSKFVRGQAAGWTLLARLALRVEQAQSCVINAFTTHEFAGEVFTLIVGSVQRDKHPDPSKRRPRPIWGVIDGLDEPACLRVALHEMLEDGLHLGRHALGWLDVTLVERFVHGFPIVGDIPDSGVYRQVSPQGNMAAHLERVAFFNASKPWWNRRLLDRLHARRWASSEDRAADAAVAEKSSKELSKGVIVGPYSTPADLHRAMAHMLPGLPQAEVHPRIMNRFGVRQKDTVRAIDNGRSNGANAASRLVETVTTPHFYFSAVVARAVAVVAQADGQRMPDMTVALLDLTMAYRTVPTSQLWLTAVAFYNPSANPPRPEIYWLGSPQDSPCASSLSRQ